MAKVGEIVIVLTTKAGNFVQGLQEADKQLTSTVETVTRLGSAFSAVGRQLLMGSAAMAAGLGLAAKHAIDFQTQMSMVATMVEDTNQWMGTLEEGVQDLGMEFGKSTDEMARGLYNVLSASIPVEDSLRALNIITESAIAGFADTGVVTKALTGVMNAYGLGVKDLTKISDIMFQGVKRGVFTYEQLSATIGKATASAAIAEVPFEELMAATSLMTRQNISAAETSTALNSAILAFVKPTKAAQKAAKELGIDLSITTLKEKGLFDAIKELMEKTEGMDETILTQLFPEKRAIKALFAMTSNAEAFGRDVTAMYESTGSTAEALAKRTDDVAFSLQRLKVTGQVLLQNFGKPMLKWISGVSEKLINFFKVLNKTFPGVKKAMVIIGGVTAALTGLGGILFLTLGSWLMLIGQLIRLAPIAKTAVLAIKGVKLSMVSAKIAAIGLSGALSIIAGAVIIAGIIAIGKAFWDMRKAQVAAKDAADNFAKSQEDIIKQGGDATKAWVKEFGEKAPETLEELARADDLLTDRIKANSIKQMIARKDLKGFALKSAKETGDELARLRKETRDKIAAIEKKGTEVIEETAELTIDEQIRISEHEVKMKEKTLDEHIKFLERILKATEDGSEEQMKLEEKIYEFKKNQREKDEREEKKKLEREKRIWENRVKKFAQWGEDIVNTFIEGAREQAEKDKEEMKALEEAKFEARRNDIENMAITTEEKENLLEQLKQKELDVLKAIDEQRQVSGEMVKEGSKKVLQYIVKQVAGAARAAAIQATVTAFGQAGLTFGGSLLALAGQIAAITAAEAGLTAILGSFQKGGDVETSGLYRLHKGEEVIPPGYAPVTTTTGVNIFNNFDRITLASEFDLNSLTNAVSERIVQKVNRATRWQKY